VHCRLPTLNVTTVGFCQFSSVNLPVSWLFYFHFYFTVLLKLLNVKFWSWSVDLGAQSWSSVYGLLGCNVPWFICWFWCYINSLFAYLTSFLRLTFFLTYLLLYLLTSLLTHFMRIGPFRFEAGSHKRWPNLALVFLCCCILHCGCMFAFVVLDLLFQSSLAKRLAGNNVSEMAYFVADGT